MRTGLSRLRFAATLSLALALLLPPLASAEAPLRVVASFSILGDLVQQVGGDRVVLTTLVGPGGDAHVFEPTPADARRLGEADVLVVNGLGFEGWIERLVEASGFAGREVVAASAVETRSVAVDHAHAHGDIDPHAWQNPANVERYVEQIRDGLAAADPAGAVGYRARAKSYLAELRVLDMDLRTTFGTIPPQRRKVVTSHDAFGYFGDAYGIAFLAPVGVNTEAEASAADVAALIRQIRAEDIPAVFVENIADPRLLEQIQRETGARLGGTLYSDALSPPEGPASTYLALMRHNAATLAAALTPDSGPTAPSGDNRP
jgi:zinc/manganese transport system substrate-binding protein